MEILNFIKKNILYTLDAVTFGDGRVSIKLLVPYVIISIIFYFQQNYGPKNNSVRGILKFIFPTKIYTHPSSIIDYKVFFISAFLKPSKILASSTLGYSFSVFIFEYLNKIYIPTWGRLESNNWTLFVVSLVGFVIFDFAAYIYHWVFHKSSLLWPFHAGHHSAEVLNPFTVHRDHPVWEIPEYLIYSLILGLSQGFFAWAFLSNIYLSHNMIYYFIFYNILNYAARMFRHSHIWFSYGPLNWVFISPAMHQIHHSAEIKHRNKNHGLFLSIWDLMFGTIYVPKERENITFGLDIGVNNPHDTLLKFYFLPFKESGVILLDKFRKIGNHLSIGKASLGRPRAKTSQKLRV